MAYAMIGAQARPKKEYIATAPFNTIFYSYTALGPTAPNFQNTGILAVLPNLTAVNCPAGRILRESGSHLYPGVNPGLQPGEANYFAGANHIWTKVYDAVTGFRGFIDANAPEFATYSNERPAEFVDNGEIDGTGSRKGPSVYTGGNVTAAGSVTAASGLTVSGGRLTLGTSIGGQATLASGTVAVTISGLTTSSRAIVTLAARAGVSTAVYQYLAVCTANTLTITAVTVTGTTVTGDTSTLNYIVFN